jgi:ABC-type polysaccharide/polyol phosphate transport system ATPase subunit
VGKRYDKVEERGSGWRSLLPFSRDRRVPFWALHDVDLRLEPGETVGVIGRNGSGKTTLLRMLCGVTQPSTGHLRIVGRIAPLIGVGVGFHPEMSGHDNVRVNGLLLGLTEDEINERAADIIAFAELADFMDTPVKFYSSGMFVRLGFAVAAHCDPGVLLVDEVLAVGDLAFQTKCIRHMKQLQEQGTTIVIVSHSINSIRDLCSRSVLIDSAAVRFDGPTDEAIGRYMEVLSSHGLNAGDDIARFGGGRRIGEGVTILGTELTSLGGSAAYLPAGIDVTYRMRVRFDQAVDHPLFGIKIGHPDGRGVFGYHTPVLHEHRRFAAGEEAEVEFHWRNNLGGGTYHVSGTIASTDGRVVHAEDAAGHLIHVPRIRSMWGLVQGWGRVVVDGTEIEIDLSRRLGDDEGGSPLIEQP